MPKKHLARTAIALSLCAPLAGFAQEFEAIETIPWPYRGSFPAYPAETARPTEVWAQAGFLYDSNAFRFASDAVAR